MFGMNARAKALKIKLQVLCGNDIAMGPGKADLLDAIAAHGSISAAARALGMSYRRAWLLVDTMNRCWAMPLVETSGRGARVSATGQDVLARYRTMQDRAGQAADDADWATLQGLLLGAATSS
jgi:molybdate transport system regulatory protein